MPAVCLTRPQYVLRSYCDSGSSRLPGMEDDMLARRLVAPLVSFFFYSCFALVHSGREGPRAGGCVMDPISSVN